ncbi:MAG: hypothetical protein ACLRMZ_15475 [Blautia marasmi]
MTDIEGSLKMIFGAEEIRQSSLEHLSRYSVLLQMKKGQHLYREREDCHGLCRGQRDGCLI